MLENPFKRSKVGIPALGTALLAEIPVPMLRKQLVSLEAPKTPRTSVQSLLSVRSFSMNQANGNGPSQRVIGTKSTIY